MPHPFTFPRGYSLKSKKRIDHLFKTGRSVSVYPLKFVYLIDEKADGTSIPPIQLLISVSKKRFALAVDRNKLKRQCREAFRTERLPFEQQLEKKGAEAQIAILYIANKKLAYNSLLKAMQMGIEKMSKTICDVKQS